MSTGGKIVIGVGIASSALLAAWLLTGNRKEKTKDFVSKTSESLKSVRKAEKSAIDEQDFYYI
jgi:hypothetical protein